MKKLMLLVCLSMFYAVSFSFSFGRRLGGGHLGGGEHFEHVPEPHPQPQPHPEPHPEPHPPHPVPPGPGPHPYPPPPGPRPYPYYPYPYDPFYTGIVINYDVTPESGKYDAETAKQYDRLNALEEKKYYYGQSQQDLANLKISNAVYSAKPSPAVTLTVKNDSSHDLSNITFLFKMKKGSKTLILNDIYYSIDGGLKQGEEKNFTVSLSGVKEKIPAASKAEASVEKFTDAKGDIYPKETFSEDDQKEIDSLKKTLGIKS